MNWGDTFLSSLTESNHLWIVLSDPKKDPDRIVVVSLTSWREGMPEECLLDVGDHPFIKHRSCIDFSWARVVCLARLKSVKIRPRLSKDILTRILNAADTSEDIPTECREIILQQGLIDAF